MEAIFTTNLKCSSCLSKVGPLLDDEPIVESWEADLTDSRKLLRIQLNDPEQSQLIVHTLDAAGFSASLLNENSGLESEAKAVFKLSTYKPLLLVLAYVVGATLFIESFHGSFAWQRAMSSFMGFFFLGFAFFKLLNVEAFADAFATYDIVAKRSRIYALLYPWIEVTLGLLFATTTLLLVANLVTVAVMAVGLIGVISAVRQNRAIQCACLGTVFNLPMSVVTVVENSVMLAMATVMLLQETIL